MQIHSADKLSLMENRDRGEYVEVDEEGQKVQKKNVLVPITFTSARERRKVFNQWQIVSSCAQE